MIYKVRVILDSKEDVFRDIEIREKQTLWNLHLGIKSAFSLQGEELSSFYYSDEDWSEGQSVPLEDLSDDGEGEIMSDVYLSEAFPKVGSRMLFKYGLIDLWEFFCELIEIADEKPAVNYPITVYRFGNCPLKAPAKTAGMAGIAASSISIDDEFNGFGESFDEDFEDDFDTEDDFETDEYYDDKMED